MLTPVDNEFLTRVGPGTPMGAMLREFWTPFLPSRDLPERDGPLKRVRLLGEDLVAFRDSNGDIGLIAENCPHRGASLFFGRNEEAGLRCNYHGWKYDVTGACLDMPNEPAESNFKDKVQVTAYPCREVNRMIWTYMGPRETPPPFPAFEVNTLPIDQVFEPSIMMEECNWIQGLEGDLDSSHVPFIHGRIAKDSPDEPGWGRGSWVDDRAPVLDVVPTQYGAVYSAKRVWNDDGERWHRITQYVLPYYTMIAAGAPNACSAKAWVPLDDHYHMLINMHGRLEGHHLRGRTGPLRQRLPQRRRLHRGDPGPAHPLPHRGQPDQRLRPELRHPEARQHVRHPARRQPAGPRHDRDHGGHL